MGVTITEVGTMVNEETKRKLRDCIPDRNRQHEYAEILCKNRYKLLAGRSQKSINIPAASNRVSNLQRCRA